MREFRADLHIHSCLSPCAELEMSPRSIVQEARRKGLDIIGICDHNSAENVPAVRRSAEKEGIKVIGGIEVTSREEVHILALFEREEWLFSLQEIIYENLRGTNNEKLYGEQVVVNEEDEVVGFNKKLLIGATEIPVEKVVDLTHKLNGLAIASHVDREGFSIVGQLGFIPDGLALDALEITDPSGKDRIPGNHGLPFITSSDAHTLDEIGGRYTCFFMKNANTAEMKKCFLGEGGREVRI
ncbi:MAG: PHP domain-containing protein [Candidatus Eisenbacteria bacterium]|nr:PHP domain-containing protein [Candidatus Eisenbacteria bacterium]